MKNLNEYTLTELLKIGNDLSSAHENLKSEIMNDSYIIEKLNNGLCDKLKSLDEIEENYIMIIEEIEKKNGNK